MKKLLCLFLATVMCFSLCSCAPKISPEEIEDAKSIVELLNIEGDAYENIIQHSHEVGTYYSTYGKNANIEGLCDYVSFNVTPETFSHNAYLILCSISNIEPNNSILYSKKICLQKINEILSSCDTDEHRSNMAIMLTNYSEAAQKLDSFLTVLDGIKSLIETFKTNYPNSTLTTDFENYCTALEAYYQETAMYGEIAENYDTLRTNYLNARANIEKKISASE